MKLGKQAAGVVAVFAVMVALGNWLVDRDVIAGGNDAEFYWRMSEGETVLAPFGYRPLVPWIVKVSPLSGHLGWLLVNSVLMTVAVVAAYVWLRARSRWAVWVAAGLVVTGPGWTALRSPYTTDGALLAALMVAAWAADRQRWGVFACLGVVGVLARDSAVVIAAVPLFVGAWRRHPAAVIAPVVTLVAVRLGVDVIPRAMGTPAETFAYRAWRDGSLWRSVGEAVVLSFGPAWLAVPVRWRRLPLEVQAWAVPAMAGVGSCLIASDWIRMLGLASPLVAYAVATLGNDEATGEERPSATTDRRLHGPVGTD